MPLPLATGIIPGVSDIAAAIGAKVLGIIGIKGSYTPKVNPDDPKYQPFYYDIKRTLDAAGQPVSWYDAGLAVRLYYGDLPNRDDRDRAEIEKAKRVLTAYTEVKKVFPSIPLPEAKPAADTVKNLVKDTGSKIENFLNGLFNKATTDTGAAAGREAVRGSMPYILAGAALIAGAVLLKRRRG